MLNCERTSDARFELQQQKETNAIRPAPKTLTRKSQEVSSAAVYRASPSDVDLQCRKKVENLDRIVSTPKEENTVRPSQSRIPLVTFPCRRAAPRPGLEMVAPP